MASGASTASAEPEFLAARRERAVALSATLELPQFKGRPGWEFTDISALDLATLEPAAAGAAPDLAPEPMFEPDAVAELRQVDAGEATLTGELPDGVIVTSLERAAAEHPELVARHLGSVVDDSGTCSWPATRPASAAARSSTCPRGPRSSARFC